MRMTPRQTARCCVLLLILAALWFLLRPMVFAQSAEPETEVQATAEPTPSVTPTRDVVYTEVFCTVQDSKALCEKNFLPYVESSDKTVAQQSAVVAASPQKKVIVKATADQVDMFDCWPLFCKRRIVFHGLNSFNCANLNEFSLIYNDSVHGWYLKNINEVLFGGGGTTITLKRDWFDMPQLGQASNYRITGVCN